MPDIATYEAEPSLGLLLDRVQSGEEILITRHGKPVARLIPNAGGRVYDPEQAKAAMQRVRARAAAAKIPFDWEEFKKDRDEGRP